jgi:hypothetical protein
VPLTRVMPRNISGSVVLCMRRTSFGDTCRKRLLVERVYGGGRLMKYFNSRSEVVNGALTYF